MALERAPVFLLIFLVTTQDTCACLCEDTIPRTPASFCLFLSITCVMTNMFQSVKIVIVKSLLFQCVTFHFVLPIVYRCYDYSDVYGCVSFWKPGVVVTRN